MTTSWHGAERPSSSVVSNLQVAEMGDKFVELPYAQGCVLELEVTVRVGEQLRAAAANRCRRPNPSTSSSSGPRWASR
jgi:hypothetical protein